MVSSVDYNFVPDAELVTAGIGFPPHSSVKVILIERVSSEWNAIKADVRFQSAPIGRLATSRPARSFCVRLYGRRSRYGCGALFCALVDVAGRGSTLGARRSSRQRGDAGRGLCWSSGGSPIAQSI